MHVNDALRAPDGDVFLVVYEVSTKHHVAVPIRPTPSLSMPCHSHEDAPRQRRLRAVMHLHPIFILSPDTMIHLHLRWVRHADQPRGAESPTTAFLTMLGTCSGCRSSKPSPCALFSTDKEQIGFLQSSSVSQSTQTTSRALPLTPPSLDVSLEVPGEACHEQSKNRRALIRSRFLRDVKVIPRPVGRAYRANR